MFPTLADKTDWFFRSVSIAGIHKMTTTHQEELFHQLRVLQFFIEWNMLLFIMIFRHRRQQNPAPAQQAPHPQPTPYRRRRKPQNPCVMPWILQREERWCYGTLLDEVITTDILGYRNFTWMEPAFFDLIWERITPHFKKPLEVGRLKLAVTFRLQNHVTWIWEQIFDLSNRAWRLEVNTREV